MITPAGGDQGKTAGSPRCRCELLRAQVAEPRLFEISARVGPNGDHELAPPAVRRAVEHRAPAIRDRWHENISTCGVLVDLARASQRDEVAEAVGERLSERGAGHSVGILAAYEKFSLAGAGAGRHLLRRRIGHFCSPPAVPSVELVVRNCAGHHLADLGERVRPGSVYRPLALLRWACKPQPS